MATRSERRSVTIAPGVRVPYPEPTSPAASSIGRGNKRRDTEPELRLRQLLHAAGLRYRVDYRPDVKDLRSRPDIVFTRRKIAVFVDGCFWHACPEHCVVPSSNTDYWIPKLRANVERDRRNDRLLEGAGWLVLRVWEHEPAAEAADRIGSAWTERAP